MVRLVSSDARPIPFNHASPAGKDLQYVADAILTGKICGNQTYTKKSEEFLNRVVDARKTLLVTSCTHALEMSALLLDLQPGDEVIIPAYTFVSTVNAFVLRGAKPIFADIRHDTKNIDETKLERLITPRTKAIVVVHYAGVACEMDAISEICRRHNLALIEDNAHGLFGFYKGRPLGSLSDMSTMSFHETKNITCGEGGALAINNPLYVERAEILREKGTNRSAFFRGQVDKYTWVDVGSSYVISDVLAAMLYGQLEQSTRTQAARRQIWNTYDEALFDWAAEFDIETPEVPDHCQQAYHMYYMVFPELETRQAFIAHLKEQGVCAVFHYQALNTSPMGKMFGGWEGQCPVAEAMADRLVRLPMYNDLSFEDQRRVIQACHSFRPENVKARAVSRTVQQSKRELATAGT